MYIIFAKFEKSYHLPPPTKNQVAATLLPFNYRPKPPISLYVVERGGLMVVEGGLSWFACSANQQTHDSLVKASWKLILTGNQRKLLASQ